MTDKRLFRHLVPEYAELETERKSASAHLKRLKQTPEKPRTAVDATSRLREILAELEFTGKDQSYPDIEAFLRDQSREDELDELTTRRREVVAMQRQLKDLGEAPAAKGLEDLEGAVREARGAVRNWRETSVKPWRRC